MKSHNQKVADVDSFILLYVQPILIDIYNFCRSSDFGTKNQGQVSSFEVYILHALNI